MTFAASVMDSAQAEDERYSLDELKSAFLLNFGRFVEWPSHSLRKNPDRFQICIIGEDSFGNNLEVITRGQKVKERVIEIAKLTPYASVVDCQIIYLNLPSEKQMVEILSINKSNNILTVSDHPSFSKIGGIVQLDTQGAHIHLKINHKAATKAGLTISSKLLALAEVVE